MGAFLGISLWIALATVVPGLVTIAVLYFAFAFAGENSINYINTLLDWNNDWITTGVGVTIMILTQAIGILLEAFLVRFKLFPGCKKLTVLVQFGSKEEKQIDAYEHYSMLYILLAQLTESEDAQGHLKRTAAQFFLTNNTMVSFLAGVVLSTYLLTQNFNSNLFAYSIGLFLCLFVSYWVAVIRFKVMTKSIWAAYKAREMSLQDKEKK